MRRGKRSLARKVIGKLVRKVARKVRNHKLWKRGKRTAKINRAHSQRGGFSL